jgi:hypothetical protein
MATVEVAPVLGPGLDRREEFSSLKLPLMLGREIWYADDAGFGDAEIHRGTVTQVNILNRGEIIVGGGEYCSAMCVYAGVFLGFTDEVSGGDARRLFCERQLERLQRYVKHYECERDRESAD